MEIVRRMKGKNIPRIELIEQIHGKNDLAGQGFRIEGVAWLNDVAWYLAKPAESRIHLNHGLLVDQRYIGNVERREIKKPSRCTTLICYLVLDLHNHPRNVLR